MRTLLAIAALAAAGSIAAADTPAAGVHATAKVSDDGRRTLIYGELLGKGGPWGLGVERRIAPRIAIGAVGSFAVIRDQQLYTLAPYLHVTIVKGRRHRLFGEIGASIVHSRVPSPVPSWDGTSETGAGGLLTAGWEIAGSRLVTRVYGAVLAGEGGVAPWLGIAFGVRL